MSLGRIEKLTFNAVKDFNNAWGEAFVVRDFEAQVLQNISLSIFSNLKSVMILLANNCVNEACYILRSAIEKTTLYIYLINFPEYTGSYAIEGHILWFKNCFCLYKDLLESPKQFQEEVCEGQPITKEGMVQDLNFSLNHRICKEAKETLVKVIGGDIITLSKDQIKKLDVFFEKEFSPTFMKIYRMWRGLEKNNSNVKSPKVNYSLNYKKLLFREYNEYSQIMHGRLQDLPSKKKDSKLYRVILRLPTLILRASIDSGLIEEGKLDKAMLEVTKTFGELDKFELSKD